MKKLAAVIVESRPVQNFALICLSHMKQLPEGTDLVVYTIPSTKKVFKEQFNKVPLKPIFKNYPETIGIPNNLYGVGGFEELLKQNKNLEPILHYCIFMSSSGFWKELSLYQRVLTFQTDTGLLRKGIEEFFDWDYIGAPCYNYLNESTVMNGGLSLRNPRIMEYICRYYGWESDLEEMVQLGQVSTASFFAEDIFFCTRMIKYNIGNYPSLEVSKKFAVESKLELNTFGYHKIEAYLTPKEVSIIKNQYKK
jgi:hypothetical protein